MKATFSYTGDLLTISLSLSGDGDQAVAKLVEKMTQAHVNVSYDRSGIYDYRDPRPDGIHVTLKVPEPKTNDCSGDESA